MRTVFLLTAAICVTLAGCQRPSETDGAAQARALQVQPKPAESAYPLTLIDDLGQEVTFDAPPQRIVSMSPPLTETLFALGLDKRIIGVTRFCQHPEAAKAVEKIGGIVDPSEEKITSLNPDVVFATVGNPKPVLESLRSSNIRVLALDPKSYDGVVQDIRTLGRICDVTEAADDLAAEMEATAGDVKAKTAELAGEERPRALLIVGLDPLYVAGPGTFIEDMLQLCGAENAAGREGDSWKQFSLEVAVAADPQVIILTTNHTPEAADADAKLEELRNHESWRGVSAVKTGRIALIESDIVLQAGPRLMEGLKQIAAAIHPELFASE